MGRTVKRIKTVFKPKQLERVAFLFLRGVAELAYVSDLSSDAVRIEGSTPSAPTNIYSSGYSRAGIGSRLRSYADFPHKGSSPFIPTVRVV